MSRLRLSSIWLLCLAFFLVPLLNQVSADTSDWSYDDAESDEYSQQQQTKRRIQQHQEQQRLQQQQDPHGLEERLKQHQHQEQQSLLQEQQELQRLRQKQQELQKLRKQQQEQHQEEQRLQQEYRRQQQQHQQQLEQQRLQQQQRLEQHEPQRPEEQHPSGPTYRPYPQRPPPSSHDDRNVITVPRLGLVRGTNRKIQNHDINAFLGLKYGSVRSGLGRFQKADPPRYNQAADETIDATREPSSCPQFPEIDRIQADIRRGINVDDCLTLNVYAPSKRGSYPVIVFIHGEMLFDGGAVEAQPDFFLEHEVVLVSVNYRLGPFGFLTSLTDELPGNVALADIQMALEWVQQYIRSFGGDPGQVTLLGQAGGATLAHALSLSGKAHGLFHKLILQSGTALNPYFLDESPLETFRAFIRAARCPTVSGLNLPNAIACFERLSTPELLEIFKRHWEENETRGLRFTGGFKLAIGDKLGYLPQHPAAMISQNTYPTLVGTTKDVGAFVLSRFYKQLQEVSTRNLSDYIDVVLKHTAQPRHHQIWKQLALRDIFTPADIRNSLLPENVAQGLLELVNLILYRGPIIDSIRYTSQKYQTFLYIFGYRGEFHRIGLLPSPLPFVADATLSDDSLYLFPYPEEVSHLNEEDRIMARTLTTKWFNFVQFGKPTLDTGNWPNVSAEYGPFVHFIKSPENSLELNHHFGEGISLPNLYPEYFTTTTTTTTTTPHYPNYPTPPNYAGYPNYAARPTPPPPQSWRAHETVLNDPHGSRMQPPQQRFYPDHRAKNVLDKRHRLSQG